MYINHYDCVLRQILLFKQLESPYFQVLPAWPYILLFFISTFLRGRRSVGGKNGNKLSGRTNSEFSSCSQQYEQRRRLRRRLINTIDADARQTGIPSADFEFRHTAVPKD